MGAAPTPVWWYHLVRCRVFATKKSYTNLYRSIVGIRSSVFENSWKGERKEDLRQLFDELFVL